MTVDGLELLLVTLKFAGRSGTGEIIAFLLAGPYDESAAKAPFFCGLRHTAGPQRLRRQRRRRPDGAKLGPVGLADALFTTTQQRVLRLLFGQPARSFFATELLALTQSRSGAVQRELRRCFRRLRPSWMLRHSCITFAGADGDVPPDVEFGVAAAPWPA